MSWRSDLVDSHAGIAADPWRLPCPDGAAFDELLIQKGDENHQSIFRRIELNYIYIHMYVYNCIYIYMYIQCVYLCSMMFGFPTFRTWDRWPYLIYCVLKCFDAHMELGFLIGIPLYIPGILSPIRRIISTNRWCSKWLPGFQGGTSWWIVKWLCGFVYI